MNRGRSGQLRALAICFAAGLLVAVLLPSSLGASAPRMVLHLINVGQGDALLLDMPDGQHILVDGGPPQAGPTVVAYLEQQGVQQLDLVIATHAHADHIGGLPYVIAALPVAAVWADSWDCATLTCSRFYEGITQRDIVTGTARAGQVFAWGEVQALVVRPTEPLFSQANDRSVVMRITYDEVSVLLTGDAEAPAEAQMLARGVPLQAQILKVAHHGSDSSSGDVFLRAVAPEQALLSVGEANPYGHPTQATLERLTASGAQIWRTDREGAIVVSTDGKTYRLVAESGRVYPLGHLTVYLPLIRGNALN